MLSPADGLHVVYGPHATARLRKSSVLVVGAGGVGCELLKNLAMARFPRITVVDLDTIDVSNLNRQFLFRRRHVGQSKAKEAAKAVSAMAPDTVIQPIMANIKDNTFDVNFFRSFSLVCNALDNLEARRHVNRMCLAAGVPLVESGSTGYNGQVSVIAKNVECYDCVERVPQKSFAVCTIRSTPEKPVHCVVWAKFLFELLFGAEDDANVLKDLDVADPVLPDNTHQNGKPTENGHADQQPSQQQQKPEEQHQKQLANGRSTTDPIAEQTPPDDSKCKPRKRLRYSPDDTPNSFSARVANRVFVRDIMQQRAMTDLWRQRQPPIAYDVYSESQLEHLEPSLPNVDLLSQKAWKPRQSAAVFIAVLEHIVQHRSKEIDSLTFDKDDRDAMLFVVAASNLRANAYGVPLQSAFSVKGIAGNIVHAIASTNAMVGGIIVLEALKIVASGNAIDKCKTTFVSQAPRGSRVKTILIPEKLQKPNPKCFVCSNGHVQLSVDVNKMTLEQLIQSILLKKMSMISPDVYVTTGDFHDTLYESGEGLEEDEIAIYKQNASKTLRSLRVENGSQLSISDFGQTLKCTIHISDVDGLMRDEAPANRFIVHGSVPSANTKQNGECVDLPEKAENVDEDEVTEVVVESKSTEGKQVSSSDKENASDCENDLSTKRDRVHRESPDERPGKKARKEEEAGNV